MIQRKPFLALSLLAMCIVGIVFVFSSPTGSVLLTGTVGDIHSTGSFSTGGNAWQLSFDVTPGGYSGAQIIGIDGNTGAYLTGIFWIQTVWWATFEDVGFGPVSIIPPWAGQNIRDPWYLSWYAWSPNAGWIKLNHGESNASWVIFLPDTRSLVGFGWSDNLGWISFTSGTVWVGSGFLWGISVWGGIGWDRSFNVLNSLSVQQTAASIWSFLNEVRKNVSIITRNAEKNGKISTGLTLTPISFNKSLIYKIDSNPTDAFLKLTDIETAWNNVTDKNRSLIVVWADIYIDTGAIIPSYITEPRAIIALKNENGQWGDIYINGTARKIESTMVSEGTIWSWDEVVAWQLSPYISTKSSIFTNIPRTQLYIRGSIVSYNTIWWSSKSWWAACPSLVSLSESCTYDTALKYDWNYFRSYDGNASNRAYPNNSKDAYSVIMEYDPRVAQNPPPGLENVRY